MTTTKPAAPLDLSQFEGHTPGPWFIRNFSSQRCILANQSGGCITYVDLTLRRKNALLLENAPALLAECRAQRDKIAALQADKAKLREALRFAGRELARYGAIDESASARAALAATQGEKS